MAISIKRQEQSKENAYEMMKNNNPSIIPRNHRVEEALEAAVTNGDFSVMEKLLEALSNPYAYSTDQEEYCIPPAPTNRPYRTFVGLDCLICKRCVHINCVNAPFYIPHSTKTLKCTSPDAISLIQNKFYTIPIVLLVSLLNKY